MKPAPIVPQDTIDLQARAADPRNSVWVSANAGSGKTHVLSLRVIRLLLEGTDPSRILCLTYTRAAAANMSNRVFRNLSRWAMLDEVTLADEIAALEGRRPAAAKIQAARKLFTEALETPGGLKIQTIHAFCESILHRFPLEANIAAQFQLLDPAMEAVLIATARRDMITGAGNGGNPALGAAFAAVLERGGEFGLDVLLGEIIAKRDDLRRFIEQVSEGDTTFAALFADFDLSPEETVGDLAARLWPDSYFDRDLAERLADRARSAGKVTAKEFAADVLSACEEADPEQRLAHLRKAFLTKDDAPRSPRNIATSGVAKYFPDLAEQFQRTALVVAEVCDRIALLRMLQGTRAALAIADFLIARYEELKAARGFLDFHDLITRTLRLLSREDAGAWVHYKLDRGIDHILLDEAQDTSPDQWNVVTRLAEEFFSGLGARDEVERTIFAVGDEKQSIYSFQGANPETFAATGRHFSQKSRDVDRKFERVDLTYSFRSTEDVLSAVDHVFSAEDVRRGVTRESDHVIQHRPIRAAAPGYVEVWPSIAVDAAEEPDDWRCAIDHASAPAVRVAETVAATIAHWLQSGERLEDGGKPIRPGDVMVLVRKRDRFVHALSRSLKNRDIAVAGADRLRLSAHIGVKDLVALGRFLLQPEDDLSLAAVLRSPIFAVSEESLFGLASGREKSVSLGQSLRKLAESDLLLRAVVDQLNAWASEAAYKPAFEFYAGVLGRDGVRAKMIARLGSEAGDILDEFLSFCLAEERAGSAGLEAVLSTLDSAGPEIKREMDQTRDEVRIMTVHAAKGLEAPVVFLVDGGSASFHSQHLPRLIPVATSTGEWRGKGFLWRAASDVANSASRKAEALAKTLADEEYRRLLYVGMTRAEDRLIVCGYHGQKAPPDTWHALVTRALQAVPGIEERAHSVGGTQVRRFRIPKPTPPADPTRDRKTEPIATALKPVFRSLVPDPDLPRGLSPSGASALIEDRETTVTASGSPVLDPEETSFAIRRGLAIHKMLQMLPEVDAGDRRALAKRYLERGGPDWSALEIEAAVNAVCGILDFEGLEPLFAPGSRAEVALTGSLIIRGRPTIISGKIDRLAVTANAVRFVDYKTNRSPPACVEQVPLAYVTQMALYRALLLPLYPDRPVQALLLFTDAPRLIPVPESAMEEALARLTRE